ncbi:ATP-grasp domain-containing protein, partial [Anaerosporobacter sp.]|uniref:ATP-grasp domain-containing protein n=1 Tax=Anaerosporobacter sp. TaxID=1872529 RepID=UPI00286F4D03
MRKILVTAIGGNVANGILKILSEGNDEIYGCDINEFPVGMDKVKVFWRSDLAVSPEYIQNLLSKCQCYGITHIIPVNESEIKVISDNIDLFESNNIKLIMQDKSVLDICLDKLNTMKYLDKFVPDNIPQTFTFDEFSDNGETYIAKLRNSCGSKFIKNIVTRGELENLPYSNDEYIIQEYLADSEEEYTIGLFASKDEVNTI